MSDLRHSEKLDNSIDDLARAAFNADEESLLKEFEDAEKLLAEGKAEPELYISKAECEASFNRLRKLMEKRGLPLDMERSVDENVSREDALRLEHPQPEPLQADILHLESVKPEGLPTKVLQPESLGAGEPARKPCGGFIRSKAFRRIVVAAALGIVMAGSALTVLGQKQLVTGVNKNRSYIITWDDGDSRKAAGSLDEAYKTIEEKTEIPALRLTYIPKGMQFENMMIIDATHAKIQFDYQGSKAYLTYTKGDQERISKFTVSDTVIEGYAENLWLKQTIPIRSNRLADGRTEYRADIVLTDTSYSWTAIMEREEFLKVIEGFLLQDK